MKALILVAILMASFSHADEKRPTWTLYGSTKINYYGFTSIDQLTGTFGLRADQFEPTKLDKVLVADLTARILHERFNYVSDGLTDHWESRYSDMMDGYFEGDCDDFALTAAEALMRAGFPVEDIYLVTGVGYIGQIKARQYDPMHPSRIRADHIFVMIWARGGWYVIDNTHARLQRAEDYMRIDYMPIAVMNVGNWTLDKVHRDFSRGWGRLWWPDPNTYQ